MKARRLMAALAMLALGATVGMAGSQDMQKFVLFDGSNTDSTVQLSRWIPVRGANRVLIRTWSEKAAWHVSTDADSAFTDTLTAFVTIFTDSVTSASGRTAGSDSIQIASTVVTNTDTTTTHAGVSFPPLQEALRGPGNGWGIWTIVFPVAPGLTSYDGSGIITKQIMRVRATPRRRLRSTSWNSTTPTSVNGLKGFHMEAYVYKENR